jgi:hypothetical protein
MWTVLLGLSGTRLPERIPSSCSFLSLFVLAIGGTSTATVILHTPWLNLCLWHSSKSLIPDRIRSAQDRNRLA